MINHPYEQFLDENYHREDTRLHIVIVIALNRVWHAKKSVKQVHHAKVVVFSKWLPIKYFLFTITIK